MAKVGLAVISARGGLGSLYRDPDAPVQPQQQKWEFERVLKIYKKLNPRIVLEIGTSEGGSLYQFMKYALPGTIFLSIEKEPGGGQWQVWAKKFQQKLYIIVGDSTVSAVIDSIKSITSEIDFLFIDGNHSYEAVKQDFFNYGSLVKSGGLIVLHDIVHKGYGVHKFWKELCREGYITQELLGCPDENEYGTGIVYDLN